MSLHPQIVAELKRCRSRKAKASDTVLEQVPSMAVLKADLAFAGIDYGDVETGFVDLHSMRKALNTMMIVNDVPQRIRQAQMRHRDPRLTECAYTDDKLLPVAEKVNQLPSISLGDHVEAGVQSVPENEKAQLNLQYSSDAEAQSVAQPGASRHPTVSIIPSAAPQTNALEVLANGEVALINPLKNKTLRQLAQGLLSKRVMRFELTTFTLATVLRTQDWNPYRTVSQDYTQRCAQERDCLGTSRRVPTGGLTPSGSTLVQSVCRRAYRRHRCAKSAFRPRVSWNRLVETDYCDRIVIQTSGDVAGWRSTGNVDNGELLVNPYKQTRLRREFRKIAGILGAGLLVLSVGQAKVQAADRPNILLAISDDQSWPHASAYGCKFVNTPAFDRVANEGVLFHNAFVPAPQCSPTRACILTGRNPWQNGDAAVHGTPIPAAIPLYTRLLEEAGYHVGMTGKGWAPGPFEGHNPAGKTYTGKKSAARRAHFKYTSAFRAFLKARQPGQPFCFWYGSSQPHRPYERGSGLKAGKTLASVEVPKFLPDHKSIRSDLLDYALEIEQFDTQLGQMLEILEKHGELENTIVVVTSDNGMPWCRAKANIYEHGVHMPLAIRWGAQVPPKRRVTDLVSLIDLAPSFLEAAGLPVAKGMSGRSLLNVLKSKQSGLVDESRSSVIVGMERHTPYVRAEDVGYPSRAIRTHRYLYIRNLKPDRWPEGDTFYGGGPSSARSLYIEQCENADMQRYIRLAWAKRPAEELFDITTDPYCLKNLAGNPKHIAEKNKLRDRLNTVLREQGDPRVAGDDRYDKQEYFKALTWKGRRPKFLKEVERVHQVMEAAGWESEFSGPRSQPEANR